MSLQPAATTGSPPVFIPCSRILRRSVFRSVADSLFPALILLTLLPGCYVRQAFYTSPFNGNSTPYHSIPLKADSMKSAFYANGAFYAGNANENGRDGVQAFHIDISRAHNFGNFQAWYGAGLSLGSYSVSRWDSSYYNYPVNGNPGSPYATYNRENVTFDARRIDQDAGNKFFGGTGVSGGLNGVIASGRREWRILGVEVSMQHEFGDYLDFRKQLPDSAATYIAKSNFFGTIGFYTEWLGKTRNGNFGVRLAGGWVVGKDYTNLDIYDNQNGRQLRYNYYNFTFHYTWTRYTSYMQVNSATKAFGLHLGINYRFGR